MPGKQVADGGAAGVAPSGTVVVAPGAVDVGEAAHRLGDDVEGGPVGVGALAGPRVAEAAQRRVDDPRVALADRLVAQPEPVHHAGAHVLEHGVGLLAQAEEGLAVGVVLQVERDAALVPVDAAEVAAEVAAAVDARLALGRVDEVFGDGRRGAGHVAGRRLHLDHVGAEVGEDGRAERPGERHRAVDDDEVAERALVHGVGLAWRPECCAGCGRFGRVPRKPSVTTTPSASGA